MGAGDRRLDRQSAVRRSAEDLGLDGLLVGDAANIRYLTGFTGSAGLLLLTPTRATLITDFRYAEQAPAETRGVAEVQVEAASLWEQLRKLVSGGPPRRIGFEREQVTVRDAERIADLGLAEAVPTTGLVEAQRIVKDAGEVAAIRAAAELAHAALAELLPTVRPGQTELEVAARLELALRLLGSEWHPFQTIVAAGPRAALPHARASERSIARGELLLIDFGAQLSGYCADITRTVVVGASADGRQREIYGIVQEAQKRGREGLTPGISGRDADALTRDVIARAGYGEAFGHSTGHGLGLEVHEAPRLARTAEEAIPAGAVVTIEPGVYLPGWGGVRIEDDVHLAPDGPHCLSDGRTELLEIH